MGGSETLETEGVREIWSERDFGIMMKESQTKFWAEKWRNPEARSLTQRQQCPVRILTMTNRFTYAQNKFEKLLEGICAEAVMGMKKPKKSKRGGNARLQKLKVIKHYRT